MKFATSLLSLAITGVLALPAPQQGGFNQGQQLPPNANSLQQSSPQQLQTQPGAGTQDAFVQTLGPGFSVLIAVETSPKGEKAIVAWAFGRSQCVERQLVSKGLNFCGKWLEFNRVPELDPGLSPTGDWEQVYVTFLGCDENSRNGDYSGIYMAVFVPGEFEGNFNQQSPNTQGSLGGQQVGQGTPQGMGFQPQQQAQPQNFQPNQLAPNQQQQQGAPLPQNQNQRLNPNQMQPANAQPANAQPANAQPNNLQNLGTNTNPNQLAPNQQQQQGAPLPQNQNQRLNPNQMQPANAQPANAQPANAQPANAQPNNLQNLGTNTNPNQLQPGNAQPNNLQSLGQQNQNLQPVGGVPASNNLQPLPQQQGTAPLPQTQQLQGANAPGSEQIPAAALAQLPQLPLKRMQQQQQQQQNQLPQGSVSGTTGTAPQNQQLNAAGQQQQGDPAELGIDPTTGQTAGLGWSGDDQSGQGAGTGTGVGGGFGSGAWGGWVGAYVEFYHCNSDREMHGCAYNDKDDTDLTTFLSCGDYAYTMDKTPDQSDDSSSSSGGGQN